MDFFHIDIPNANRANNNALVEFDVVYVAGRPNVVSIRPIRQGGVNVAPLRTFGTLANSLRLRVLQELRNHLHWNDVRLRQNITGSLMMYNRSNNEHTFIENTRLTEIVAGTFEDHFERATAAGSRPDLQLYDVEWRYWINPASYQGGAAPKFKNQKNYDGIVDWKFEFKKYSNQDMSNVNCATLSLSLAINKNQGKDRRYFITKQFNEFCIDLQTKMEFKDLEHVTLEEMGKIVELYPSYRLVIIQSAFINNYTKVGSEYSFDPNHKQDKTLYIFHDLETHHYVRCSSPERLAISMKSNNKNIKWCYECCTYYNSLLESSTCSCGNNQGEKRKPPKASICHHCNKKHFEGSRHRCGETKCHFCTLYYKKQETKNHRCPLFVDPKSFMKVFKGDENNYTEWDSKKPQSELWCWDIESYLVPTEDETLEFETDINGHFVIEKGLPKSFTVRKNRQLPNFIAIENVFDGRKMVFEDIKVFAEFALTNNDGYNLFLAHNSSSYDSRLLFEAISDISSTGEVVPIFRGTKFMRLEMNGRTIFQDTLLHLTRSLAELGKAFGLAQTKGHFPHLFNTLENIDYIGPIPEKKYFDLTFSCRKKEDFDEFNKWHDEWQGDWNFRTQRELYCINDVTMLCQIVKMYHEETIKSISDFPYLTISPWFFPTLASHVHKLMIRHLHEGHYIDQMSTDQLQEYTQKTWSTLEPEEFYFAKSALRGGSTNICRYIFEGKFHYQDIQSSYPSVQMNKDNLYPVGTPIIEVHDLNYYPCKFCYAKRKCNHTFDEKKRFIEDTAYKQKLKIKYVTPPNLHEYCLDFFGIICVDITPPRNLYHPLIQGYDEKRGKVIGSLDPIVKETITSAHLHEAINNGYIVTKIYRADRYKSAESIYRNGLLGHLYLSKMKNSGKVPPGPKRDLMKQRFMDEFNIDLGDVDLWDKRPVLKAIAKGPPTAAWGKHAESVDHPKSVIFNESDESGMYFYQSLLDNYAKLDNIRSIGSDRTMFTYKDTRENVRPDLHKGYMPVAVFVTSYGRIKLWRELNKLGKRVIMYDTDSIIYECDCCDGKTGYRIEEGDCLGDWETEEFEDDNGLAKFYAIGPKSYSLIGTNGKSTMKLKGACIKYAHEKLINPEIMKDMVVRKTKVLLPQLIFEFKFSTGMTTRRYCKLIRFHEKDVKGTFNWDEYRAYPFGYSDNV